jgi:hypothetical protein
VLARTAADRNDANDTSSTVFSAEDAGEAIASARDFLAAVADILSAG